MEDAEYVIFAYGSAGRICLDTVDLLREQGVKAGMFRPVTLFPFPEKQIAALHGLKGALTVEMAKPEMFGRDVKLFLDRSIPVRSYIRCGGNMVEPEAAAQAILKMTREE